MKGRSERVGVYVRRDDNSVFFGYIREAGMPEVMRGLMALGYNEVSIHGGKWDGYQNIVDWLKDNG